MENIENNLPWIIQKKRSHFIRTNKGKDDDKGWCFFFCNCVATSNRKGNHRNGTSVNVTVVPKSPEIVCIEKDYDFPQFPVFSLLYLLSHVGPFFLTSIPANTALCLVSVKFCKSLSSSFCLAKVSDSFLIVSISFF